MTISAHFQVTKRNPFLDLPMGFVFEQFKRRLVDPSIAAARKLMTMREVNQPSG